MPAPQSTPQTTKDRLRDAARSLFAERGYAGVSMRDLAEAVGLRPSAIYNHFPSKQALLFDLMHSHMHSVLTQMQAAITTKTDPLDAFQTFCRFHIECHIDRPKDVFLAYMELRSLEEPGRGTIIALRNTYETALRRILTEGQKTGTFAPGDPALRSRAILAMLTGVTVWYRDKGPQNRLALVEDYVAAATGAAGATPGP